MSGRRRTREKAIVLRSLEAVTPSIQDLPRDIICEIFSHCTETININVPPQRITRAARTKVEPLHPWNLARVCSTWRQAALVTHSLWNDITIVLKPEKESEWRLLRGLAELCLSRTGRSLVSLHILVNSFYKPSESMVSISQPIIDFILPYLGRLKHLSLEPCAAVRQFLALPPSTVHALESVRLCLADGWNRPPIATVFHNASNIFKVTMMCGSFATPRLDLPWAQITFLELVSNSFIAGDFYAVLPQCINLVHVKLPIPLNDYMSIPNLLLPRLESLTVYLPALYQGIFGGFLRPFVFPCLKQLQIDARTATWSKDALSSLIKRSSCLLEHLDTRSIGALQVFTVLTDAPSLAEVSLRHVVGDKGSLVLAIVDGTLTPKLHKITCDVDVATCLINCVVERKSKLDQAPLQSYTKLRSISIDCTTGKKLGQSTRKSISALRAEGMDITLIGE